MKLDTTMRVPPPALIELFPPFASLTSKNLCQKIGPFANFVFCRFQCHFLICFGIIIAKFTGCHSLCCAQVVAKVLEILDPAGGAQCTAALQNDTDMELAFASMRSAVLVLLIDLLLAAPHTQAEGARAAAGYLFFCFVGFFLLKKNHTLPSHGCLA